MAAGVTLGEVQWATMSDWRTFLVVSALTIAAIVWSFSRQWRSMPIGWSWLLLLGRTTVLAAAIWMLAQPERVLRHQEVRPSRLSVLIDTSASMEVADVHTMGKADATESTSAEHMLHRIDFALYAADTFLQRADRDLGEVDGLRAAVRELDHATQFVDRAESLLADYQQLPQRRTRLSSAPSASVASTSSVLESLRSVIRPGLQELQSALSAESPQNDSWLSLKPRWEECLSELAFVARQAAQWAAISEAADGATRDSESLVPVSYGLQPSSRIDAVRALFTEQLLPGLDEASKRVDAQFYTFDSNLQRFEQDGTLSVSPRSETDLLRSVAKVSQQSEFAGKEAILVFTDGRQTAPANPAELDAVRLRVPVFAVPFGAARQVPDIALLYVDSPRAVKQDDSIVIRAVIGGRECDGRSAEVVLRQGGEIVGRETVEFQGKLMDRQVSFRIAAGEAGVKQFHLEVETQQEADRNNNARAFDVLVVKDKVNVLLMERSARWEYRFLVQLFRRDESIEFNKLLLDMPEAAEGSIAPQGQIPRSAAEWQSYDVIILGDIAPHQLGGDQLEGLAEHVTRQGGQLVVIAGDQFMPHAFRNESLRSLLPVEPTAASTSEDFDVTLTDLGNQHLATQIGTTADESARLWQTAFRAVPGSYVSPFRRPRPAAQTLIELSAPTAAAVSSPSPGSPQAAWLCWHRVGAGRVVYLSSPTTYQLRYRQGDRLHHRFWGQMMRWLTMADSQDYVRLGLRVVSSDAEPQRPIVVEATVDGDQDGGVLPDVLRAEAVREGDDASSVSVLLTRSARSEGHFQGSFTVAEEGRYAVRLVGTGKNANANAATDTERDVEARVHSNTAIVSVLGGATREMIQVARDQRMLDKVTEASGGRVIHPAAIPELLEMLKAQSLEIHHEQRTPIWNRWSTLVLIMSLLSVDWIGRRWLGFL